jgi:hypothetical protein
MRISNVIKRLEHIKDKEGDINVYKTNQDGVSTLVDSIDVITNKTANVKVVFMS